MKDRGEQSHPIRYPHTYWGHKRYGKDIHNGFASVLINNLRLFRNEYPCHQKEIAGVSWEYILAGEGLPPILLLPGILGSAESTWQLVKLLAKNHRVLAVTYPAMNANMDIVDGLAELLASLQVERPVVYGGSYGGFIAQIFVRRHPEKVTKLILSHTTPPDPWRGRKVRKVAPLVDWLPQSINRWFFLQVLNRLLIGQQRTSLRCYFSELISQQTSKQYISSVCWRMVDFDCYYHFTADDLNAWSGKILMCLSDDDPLTPLAVRKSLNSLYPKAALGTFSGCGHLSAILKEDEIAKVIEEFINDSD